MIKGISTRDACYPIGGEHGSDERGHLSVWIGQFGIRLGGFRRWWWLRFPPGAALSAKAVFKPTKEFHTARHTLYSSTSFDARAEA